MRTLIIGAGIAGPVTAMAMHKAGIEALVVEGHSPSDGEVGSYFTVSPNGLDALAAIDALGVAQAIGFATRRNIMRNSTGHVLGALPLGTPLADGTPALTMKRSRLAKALAEEAHRRGIEIRYGTRLVGAEALAGGGVEARFDDGTTDQTDVLVGADGVHSLVRRLIDPSAPSGRYVGLTNFGGITTASTALDVGLEPESWQFTFGRHAFFGAHQTPAGDVVWFVNGPRPEITAAERAATSADTWKTWLAGLFEDDAPPAASLIRAGRLELAADNTYDLGHVPTWHRGGMIVIGDAAHAPAPSSGQGASMAMEDGVTLARALRDRPTVTAAFEAFEAARRERVEKIVAYGARSSSTKTPGRFGSLFRDAFMRVAFRYLITERALAWMYDHRIAWSSHV
jgi:2-polyprenyl-6-methoxyphenol hydroxylase-like FAD-dependent oxidoreductase